MRSLTLETSAVALDRGEWKGPAKPTKIGMKKNLQLQVAALQLLSNRRSEG
jgi:hypothetical protein